MGTVIIADGAGERRRWREATLRVAGMVSVAVACEDELFKALALTHPDAVVLDQGLPHRGGLAVCRRMRAEPRYRHTPVLLMAPEREAVTRVQALDMGCTDLLPSGAPARLFQARVASLLRAGHGGSHPFPVARAAAALVESAALEDPDFRRVAYQQGSLAALMGEALGLDEEERQLLWTAGVLHDIGVLGVPHELRRRQGHLSLRGYQGVQRHAVQGEAVCAPLGMPHLAEAVRHHHERWDGRGYPDGLAAEAIPLAARILAVVDTYHALTTDRPYRNGGAREEALATLRSEAGRQLDPPLVETMAALARREGV